MNHSFVNEATFLADKPNPKRVTVKKQLINRKSTASRVLFSKIINRLFLLATCLALFVLAVLIFRILSDGLHYINWRFITATLSTKVERAGIIGAIVGTIGLMLIVVPVTLIIGVGTAIYLEEYAQKGRFQTFIKTNISNLASVPSIIFGLLGLTVFSRFLKLGSSILAAGLTLSLLVLPIVIVASQEAIKAVPSFLKEASYGLGADKWTTIRHIVLPIALPGILTGAILAISRAIGETAPLVALGIPMLIIKLPNSLLANSTALPIQIYYWTLDSVLNAQYANLAAATIIVLMTLLTLLNAAAVVIRNKF